ncbi:MAG: tRNA dihydrouridine synthase [Planctomycetota bacterium]
MEKPRAFRSLQIGSVTLDSPVTQAALSGYSDWAMRIIGRRLGASYALCEVMLDQFLLRIGRRQRTRHFLYLSDEDHPVGGQLMGAAPDEFAAGAERLVEAGFDVVDINFGCPVKKVLGKQRGGYHLGHPRTALEIVRRTRAAVPEHVPVTIKLRRGIDDSPSSRAKFHDILKGAFQLGVSAATVHGRTVAQRYEGPSNWAFLKHVKQRFPSEIILGSGDLFAAPDCLRMMEETGVDGVTVARGAIGNPWIFAQIRALAAGHPMPVPSLSEQQAVIREHYRLAEQLHGPQRCGPLMRKFGIKYSRLHPRATAVRDAFVRVRNRADWQHVLDQWYSKPQPGRAGTIQSLRA